MSPVHRNEGEISSVGRAAELLKQFRSGDGVLKGAALTRASGLPKATAHRMLHEMVRVGLLDRTGDGYRPSLLLFELGQLVPRQRNLHEAARSQMSVLHEATGHNVCLAVQEDSDVVYVDILRGSRSPRLPQRVGGRWPLHASCAGKAILANTPAADIERALERPLRRLTPQTITDPEELRVELDRVRRNGLAFDRCESFPAIVGVASPILTPDGDVVGALSVSGQLGRINLARVDAAVRTSALTISRELAASSSMVRSVMHRGPVN